MDSLHILLVDDDMALLEALPHMIALRLSGVTVKTTNSAQEALALLQGHDYDAIVSDIKMPGMDGLELLTRIQELRPDVPTLLITGHAEQSLLMQALRGGAYDFIQKPIDRVYFVAALNRAIQTRQLRRRIQEQQVALERHAQALEQLVEKRTRELLAANEAMEMLVRDTLDISLLETERLTLHPIRCDLVNLCQQVLNAYTTGAGLALHFEFTREPIEVKVDPERISQVLIHLLFNARKFSSKGSPIEITLQKMSNEAVVTVRTMGNSVAEIQLPQLLERFYPGPRSEDNPQTSIGLGLYLSQQIIERHGGRIEVQANAEMGNPFSVILPLSATMSVEHTNEAMQREPALYQPPQWLIS